MDQDLPEALRLADELENDHQWLAQEEAVHIASMLGAHAELRRQHAEIERLNAERDAMGRMMGARQDERDTLRAELDRWHSELSAVMRPDFKDWESVVERPTLAAWVITNQRERYAWAEGVIERLTKERDSLVRAVEIIAVGDAENPQAQAAEELIALGFWRDTPEAREITAPQPVKLED